MKDDEIENIISEYKFTPEKITKEIEELVWQHDISYWEATVKFMTEHNIEAEYFQKMVTPGLWERLRDEAEKLNLIQKETHVF